MQKSTLFAGLAAAAALSGAPAQAATLVNFTFDAGTNVLVNPNNTAANPDVTNVTAWTIRDGSLISNGLTGKPNTGRAIGATSFGAGAGADPAGNVFSFQFDVSGILTLSDFAFWEQGSNGANGLGPTAWTLSVNGTQVASGAATQGSPGGDHSGVLSLGGLTGTITVAIGATGAGNDATATWRVDNFSLGGTVVPAPVPLPATLPMLAGAAGLLALRRRRA